MALDTNGRTYCSAFLDIVNCTYTAVRVCMFVREKNMICTAVLGPLLFRNCMALASLVTYPMCAQAYPCDMGPLKEIMPLFRPIAYTLLEKITLQKFTVLKIEQDHFQRTIKRFQTEIFIKYMNSYAVDF